jgi:hypothetical protein
MVKRTVIYEADDGSSHKSSVEADMHNKAIEIAKVLEKAITLTEESAGTFGNTDGLDYVATAAKLLKTHSISVRKARGPRKTKKAEAGLEPAKKKAA